MTYPSRRRAWLVPLHALIVFAGLSEANPGFARAQQAIISLPSADITPGRKLFGMVESQFRPVAPKPYYNSTTFFCFGLDGTTELAVSLYNAGVPSTRNMTVANGFKSVVPVAIERFKPWEPKVTFGMMGLFSLDQRGLGLWAYSHLSVRVPGHGPRLTVGLSHSDRQLTEVRATAAMLAVEQPVQIGHAHLELVAEWFSGQHDLGNFIYGVMWKPDPVWVFVLGHKVPTSGPVFGTSKMGVVFEFGVTL
ncbi:MAG: hypothetical protein U0183_23945 [Polyangiaceae bacterium]